MKLTSIISAFTILVGISTGISGGLIFSLYGIFAPYRLITEIVTNYKAEYTLPLVGFIIVWAILSSIFSRLSIYIKGF